MAKAKKLKSGNWRVLVYSHTEDVNGKSVRRYKSFTHPNRKQAELMAAQYAASKKSISKYQKITVKEAITKYIESKANVLSPSTIRSYKSMMNTHFDSISNRNIFSLSQEEIQAFVNECAITQSPKSVKNINGLLSPTLKMFRPDFRVTLTLPQKIKHDIYVPSDSDIVKLIESVQGKEIEKAILLAAFGSLRRSEIAALTRADIIGNSVVINKAVVNNEKNEWVLKSPKTFASYRTVELPQFVIDKISKSTDKIVNLNPGQITKHFKRAFKSVNIPCFRFHDLRHYQASILHALGIPDLYIMSRGGWKSVNTLNNIYKHEMDAKKKEVNEIANEHFTRIMQHGMQHKK